MNLHEQKYTINVLACIDIYILYLDKVNHKYKYITVINNYTYCEHTFYVGQFEVDYHQQ